MGCLRTQISRHARASWGKLVWQSKTHSLLNGCVQKPMLNAWEARDKPVVDKLLEALTADEGVRALGLDSP